MSNEYQQKVEALKQRNAVYANSLKKLNEVTEYLSKCKHTEALSLSNGNTIIHVINEKGKDEFIENSYVQNLLNDVRKYRVELAKGLVSNEKDVKSAVADLEKSRKDLRY
jgi:hypothetical protein